MSLYEKIIINKFIILEIFDLWDNLYDVQNLFYLYGF